MKRVIIYAVAALAVFSACNCNEQKNNTLTGAEIADGWELLFNGTDLDGWQCEVAPKGRDTGGIYESYGRGWLYRIPDEKEDVLKEGEWNTLRLKVEGDHVRTWLNDVPMTDIFDEKIGAVDGQMMLQLHEGNDCKLIWRNIKVKQL